MGRLIPIQIIMLNILVAVIRPRMCTGFSSYKTGLWRTQQRRQPICSPIVNQQYHLSTRQFASKLSNDNDNKSQKNSNQKRPRKKKNLKYKPKPITQDNIDKLAAAFDDLATKEGFGSELSLTAEDSTFEDYFEDDFDDDDFEDEAEMVKDKEVDDMDSILDLENFDLSDFDERAADNDDDDVIFSAEEIVDGDDDDEDYLDFGSDDGIADDDMDARIAAAQRDMARGQVSVPEELDTFAESVSESKLKELGFKRELNPYGDDETPRKDSFKLISNAMSCSACGADFQCRNEQKPGFLPADKFDIQTKLAKLEELQNLKEKAESSDWSPEDEIEYLIQTSGDNANPHIADDPLGAMDIDIDAVAEDLGIDLVQLSKKRVICKRCHGLQNFGKVDDSLRPGWTEEPTMSQEKFKQLLQPISEKPAVLIALVDLFDFGGSVLRELDGIAGDNPVILCANKVDLLPPKMGKQRAENWVRRELEYMGVQSLANVGGSVCLISSKTGAGVNDMLRTARSLAEDRDCDVYIVGAANAGKSTLINWVLGREKEIGERVGKIRAGNRNAFKGALTASPLPGTTLKFVKVDLGGGRNLYDTPGLLVPGTFTQLLTPEELKVVCPKK